MRRSNVRDVISRTSLIAWWTSTGSWLVGAVRASVRRPRARSAPRLAAQIRRATDLTAHTLIVVRGHERGYEPFLTDALTLARAPRSLSFDSCFEALRAAEHGLCGPALGFAPRAHALVPG
jgi:hypothetical protein